MGISNLLNLLKIKHQKCILTKKNFEDITPVDHILVDVCQFYYFIPQTVFDNPAKASDQIFQTIMKIINANFETPKTIYFAFEGSGPRTKQLLQRSRRGKKAGTLRYPNVAKLSCGAEYMQEIKDELCLKVAAQLTKDTKWNNTQFLVSGPETIGKVNLNLFNI